MCDFTIEDDVLVCYNGCDCEVIVPEGVTTIGEEAFRYSQLPLA